MRDSADDRRSRFHRKIFPGVCPECIFRKKYCQANCRPSTLCAMRTILLILLILLLLGALPLWPYSGSWGYFPSGGLVVLIIIVILLVKA